MLPAMQSSARRQCASDRSTSTTRNKTGRLRDLLERHPIAGRDELRARDVLGVRAALDAEWQLAVRHVLNVG